MARAPLAGKVAVAALLAATLGWADSATAATGKGVRCSFGTASHVLRLTIEADPADPKKNPRGLAYLGVQQGFVFVLAGRRGAGVRCSGPSPTIRNIESVQVTHAKKLRSMVLYVDQRTAPFAPGNTDEKDGSSEIEFDLDLGPDGIAYVFMTENDDAVYVGAGGLTDYVNLNAREAVPDTDVTTRNGSALFVDGRAGDDLLVATAGPPGPYDPAPPVDGFGVALFGGPGADALFATEQTDFLAGGGGRDWLVAGGGDDLLITRDRTRDDVDCGDGGGDVAQTDARDVLRSCERLRSSRPVAVPRATRLLPRGAPDQLPVRLRKR